jgi:hypothetical protein
MKGSYLRVLPTFLTLHSFSVTFFYPRFSPFLIQFQLNTHDRYTPHPHAPHSHMHKGTMGTWREGLIWHLDYRSSLHARASWVTCFRDVSSQYFSTPQETANGDNQDKTWLIVTMSDTCTCDLLYTVIDSLSTSESILLALTLRHHDIVGVNTPAWYCCAMWVLRNIRYLCIEGWFSHSDRRFWTDSDDQWYFKKPLTRFERLISLRGLTFDRIQ